MTAKELELITRLRHYQKKYAVSNNALHKREKEAAEREVDAMLEAINGQLNSHNNTQNSIEWNN
jgi:hypothetical protein